MDTISFAGFDASDLTRTDAACTMPAVAENFHLGHEWPMQAKAQRAKPAEVKPIEVAVPQPAFVSETLNYFYPVHYRFGMEMEAVMGQGRVGRKQSAMLWLVHSQSGDQEWVARKTIESMLSSWFEISNSKISRMINELSLPPLRFVESVGSPESRREKLLRLTDEGKQFVDGMIAAASSHVAKKLGHLSHDQLRWGLEFFNLAFLDDQDKIPARPVLTLQPFPAVSVASAKDSVEN